MIRGLIKCSLKYARCFAIDELISFIYVKQSSFESPGSSCGSPKSNLFLIVRSLSCLAFKSRKEHVFLLPDWLQKYELKVSAFL